LSIEFKRKGRQGDRNEQPKDSTMHILNDLERAHNNIVRVQSNLERGQQEMVELLTQVMENT